MLASWYCESALRGSWRGWDRSGAQVARCCWHNNDVTASGQQHPSQQRKGGGEKENCVHAATAAQRRASCQTDSPRTVLRDAPCFYADALATFER